MKFHASAFPTLTNCTIDAPNTYFGPSISQKLSSVDKVSDSESLTPSLETGTSEVQVLASLPGNYAPRGRPAAEPKIPVFDATLMVSYSSVDLPGTEFAVGFIDLEPILLSRRIKRDRVRCR